MNGEQRYKLAQVQDISSLSDIRAFAKNALLEDGVDIDIINVSEEGVKINSFKKLVKIIYDLGFREGVEQKSLIRGEKKRLEREGKIMTSHQRKARFMAEHNELNK